MPPQRFGIEDPNHDAMVAREAPPCGPVKALGEGRRLVNRRLERSLQVERASSARKRAPG